MNRVRIRAGETRTVLFTLTPADLALVDEEGESRIVPGRYRITIGGAAPLPRSAAPGAPRA